MADDDVSKLPKFEQYRDPEAEPEKPDRPPSLYPSVWKWALAGLVVGGFIGGVPEFLALLSRKVEPAAAVVGSLLPALYWGAPAAVIGALIGGFIDERGKRHRD